MTLRKRRRLIDVWKSLRPAPVHERYDTHTKRSASAESSRLHGGTDLEPAKILNYSDSGTQHCDVSSKSRLMDTASQTYEISTEHLDQKCKEPMGQHSRNVDAFTQCEIIPTTVEDLHHFSPTPVESIDFYTSGCMELVSEMPGKESAHNEQTNMDLRQWHSNTSRLPVHSYPLLQYLNSTSESGVVEDSRRSSRNDTAIDDEQTSGVNVILQDGLAQSEYEEDKLNANCHTDSALDALHLSAIPPAEEYWAWDHNVERYYHWDEDTQSLTWYGILD